MKLWAEDRELGIKGIAGLRSKAEKFTFSKLSYLGSASFTPPYTPVGREDIWEQTHWLQVVEGRTQASASQITAKVHLQHIRIQVKGIFK